MMIDDVQLLEQAKELVAQVLAHGDDDEHPVAVALEAARDALYEALENLKAEVGA